MTTEKIIVEREVDGERCGLKCECLYVNRSDDWRCILDEDYELGCQSSDDAFYVLRCPRCLSTPPAEVLTGLQREVLRGVLWLLNIEGKWSKSRELCTAFPWMALK